MKRSALPSSAGKGKSSRPSVGSRPQVPPDKAPQPVGLKPRPVLFRWLLVVTIVWLIVLLVLFFTTIYPNRAPHGPVSVPARV